MTLEKKELRKDPFPLLYLRYYEEDDNDGGILRQTWKF